MTKLKYNIEFFKNWAIEKNGECLSDTYINCNTKLEFKCSCGNIWKAEPRHIVEGRWCPRCGHQVGRLYDIDHEFFSRDTEETFYVSGFLAADGWKTRKVGGGYTIGLELCAKDVDHLKNIRDIMKCTSPIKFRIKKRKKTDLVKTTTFSYTFVANSEKCYSDLERFGVVERKTYKLRMSEWLCNHPLVHHFMRGYIDGDGCFYINNIKNEIDQIRFNMKGTKEFLEAFHNVLFFNNVCDDKDREIVAKAGKKWLAFGTLSYGGNQIISKMYDFLYHDATIFLPRKEVIARRAKEIAVYGNGTAQRRKNRDALPITKEILLEKARELGSGNKIGKFFGCTGANISFIVRNLEMAEEYHQAIKEYKTTEDNKKLNPDVIYKLYQELGTCLKVAKKLKVDKFKVSKIVKSIKLAAKNSLAA